MTSLFGVIVFYALLLTFLEVTSVLGLTISMIRVVCFIESTYVKEVDTKGAFICSI